MKSFFTAAAATILALSASPAMADDQADAEREAKRMSEVDAEAFAELTEGRVAGEPQSCINTLGRGNNLRIVEHVGMVYERGDTVWIALANNPRSLSDHDVPVIRRTGSQLCKFDQITLVDRGSQFFSGVLFLDDFVPYTKVEDAEAG